MRMAGPWTRITHGMKRPGKKQKQKPEPVDLPKRIMAQVKQVMDEIERKQIEIEKRFENLTGGAGRK